MLKKIFIALVSLAIISASMSSCAVVAEPQAEESQTPTTTVTTTTTVPTTTVNKMDEISEKLAKLTKEDGTGEINLQMNVDEISEVLTKYGIEHEVNESRTCVNLPTGGNYITDSFAGYGSYHIMQSYSGLKVGDSTQMVIKIYGKPDEIRYGTSRMIYVYNHGMVTFDECYSPIEFTVQIHDNAVKEMFVGVDFPFDQVYGDGTNPR